MLPKGFMWVLIIVPAPGAVPTCAPLVRVPIKRRRIKPLGHLLASFRACLPGGKWRFARRRQAASPCAGRQPELGWGGRPWGGKRSAVGASAAAGRAVGQKGLRK